MDESKNMKQILIGQKHLRPPVIAILHHFHGYVVRLQEKGCCVQCPPHP